MLAEARTAEQCGFHGMFFGEHHQDKDGFVPSPLLLAAAVASQTSLEVGTSVLLLPLHHPVRVAEDAAVVDLLSSGRLKLGVGIGYQQADFDLFQVPKAERVERFTESIDILRKCWTGERFSHEGKHWNLKDVRVMPRPHAAGGIPLWIGGVEPPAVARAARIGDAWVSAPSVTLESVTEATRVYREEARAHGRPAVVALMRDAWVAESRSAAREQYEEHIRGVYKYAVSKGADTMKGMTQELSFDDLIRDRLIFGDPKECIEQVRMWKQAIQPDYIILRMRQVHSGGPAHALVDKAIRLFGEAVIPHV
jgi:alkanesulfonate monooxygenase SsuD/methylene tetrahydromethanopterin reductase-like flavin-dependent oxidoreductase (luciferase family)